MPRLLLMVQQTAIMSILEHSINLNIFLLFFHFLIQKRQFKFYCRVGLGITAWIERTSRCYI